jgi:hypothetical protein
VWRAVYDNQTHPSVKGKVKDIHKMCGMGVDYVLKNSLLRRSLDNVTVVIIGFNNFKHCVFGKGETNKKHDGRDASVEDLPGDCKEDMARSLAKNINSIEQNKVIERTKSANLPKFLPNREKLLKDGPAAAQQPRPLITGSSSLKKGDFETHYRTHQKDSQKTPGPAAIDLSLQPSHKHRDTRDHRGSGQHQPVPISARSIHLKGSLGGEPMKPPIQQRTIKGGLIT